MDRAAQSRSRQHRTGRSQTESSMAPVTAGFSVESVRNQFRTALAHGQLMLQRLDGELAQVTWLNAIQQRTGGRVPRLYLFLGLFLGAFSFLFLGIGAPLFRRVISAPAFVNCGAASFAAGDEF